MQRSRWQLIRLCARVAAFVLAVCLAGPRHTLDMLNVLLNILLIDWLATTSRMSGADARSIDEHTPAIVAVASRLATTLRASNPVDAVGEPWVGTALEAAWCAACLFATLYAKCEGTRNALALTLLNVQFLALALLLPAQPDGPAQYASRAGMFAALCACLYAELPQRECMLGPRGYLLCFLPVLLVQYTMAVAFALLGLAAIVLGDVAQARERAWPRAVAAYEEVPVI